MHWKNGSKAVARIWYEAWFKRILCSLNWQSIKYIYRQLTFINFDIYFRESIDMMRKKFVFCHLSRCVSTRRIQFPLQNIHEVSFSDNDDVICCFVSRSKDLLCNLSIFFFSVFTERLGGCLYKCWCIVKFSILMSTTRKNSFFQSLRACTPTIELFILLQLIQVLTPGSNVKFFYEDQKELEACARMSISQSISQK